MDRPTDCGGAASKVDIPCTGQEPVCSFDVCNYGLTVEDRMSDEKMARLRQLRNAALVAIVIPAALLGACSQPAPPPPPPQPAPAYSPPPPPPPPVRG